MIWSRSEKYSSSVFFRAAAVLHVEDLCFGFDREDQPGQVVRVLEILAKANINMIKLESRPSKAVLGEYVFLVDINGHREDPHIADALAAMQTQTGFLKIFGSYPCYAKD